MNQNLKSARDDVVNGRLSLIQALNKWDLKHDELLKFMMEQDLKEKDSDNDVHDRK
tara:strand:- start:487 stop:654 length:168 start_codon:yes stop_codon:yes gene_type:complete